MSSLDLRVATLEESNNSIWHKLPEDEFRKHLVELEECTNAVPIDPWVTSMSKDESQHEIHRQLMLLGEQQLANDFASVAAVEEGAQSVSAVCIEEFADPEGLTIRFAAVDAIDEQVQQRLQEIANTLSAVATAAAQEQHVVTLQADLFSLIVKTHHRRLLGRLRSNRWEKPKFLSRTHKKALWQDFDNLLHRVQFLYTKKEAEVKIDVERRISTLASIYKSFEVDSQSSEAELTTLHALIQESYSFCLCPTIRTYAVRLNNRNTTKQVAAAIKTLNQIEKIAAYQRISLTLTQTARKYPVLFQNINLAFLTPYPSTPTSIAYESWAKTCHVHAEVQLAVYYDLENQTPSSPNTPKSPEVFPPRIIGTSKHLCYLCHLFLLHHPHPYHITNTHGRLYDQWTIPDLPEQYTSSTISRYQTIIEKMDRDIRSLGESVKSDIQRDILDGKRRGEREKLVRWRPEPMTSRECLLLLPSSSSSPSSVVEIVD